MIPDKKTVMLKLLEEAWVFVHLDPRREGVVLPEHLKSEKHIILQYGYNMPVPIHDLVVDERGIAATLSFRRVMHSTFIPWLAVFALADGEKQGLVVWQEDMPADLNPPEGESLGKAPDKAAEAKTDAGTEGKVEGKTDAKPGKPGKRPRPSWLKLVD